jgi:hypothetical protein
MLRVCPLPALLLSAIFLLGRISQAYSLDEQPFDYSVTYDQLQATTSFTHTHITQVATKQYGGPVGLLFTLAGFLFPGDSFQKRRGRL